MIMVVVERKTAPHGRRKVVVAPSQVFLEHELKKTMPSVFKEQVATVSSVENYDPTPASNHAARVKMQTCNYNFEVDGATAAGVDFSVPLGEPIPAGSVITRVFVTNSVASVGPTNLGLGVVASNDLIASAAISGAPWLIGTYEASLVAPLTATTAANPTGTTALLLTPTVAGHSAGNITFTVEWLEPSANSYVR